MEKDQSTNPAVQNEDRAIPEKLEHESTPLEKLSEANVHCFPANPKQVWKRRIWTVLLALLCVAAFVFVLISETFTNLFLILIAAVFIGVALVFIQTFLIENYRVAIDYKNKNVVLRYMFQKLMIPFENFDSRDGAPDQAEKAISQIQKSRAQRQYLILDNVYEDACYQTSSYDLASMSDFLTLKEEAERIGQTYKAKERFEEEQRALKAAEEELASEALSEADIEDIIHSENEGKSKQED